MIWSQRAFLTQGGAGASSIRFKVVRFKISLNPGRNLGHSRMALLRPSRLQVVQNSAGVSILVPPLPSVVRTPLTSAYDSSLRLSAGRIAESGQQFLSWGSNRKWEQLLGYRNMSSTRMRRRAGKSGLIVEALQGAGRSPRRLVDVIRAIPRLSKAYFKSPFRRALYGGISLLGGFYVAQTISLSFGALGVNDVIAAAMCVLFAEYVTRFYYTRQKVSFTVALLNNFKMGFTYGLFIDAFKLAS